MRTIECPNCGHRFTPGVDPEWAKRMRDKRQATGMSLRKLADSLDFSAAYVSDIERGKRNKPHPKIVDQWEQYLEDATDAEEISH